MDDFMLDLRYLDEAEMKQHNRYLTNVLKTYGAVEYPVLDRERKRLIRTLDIPIPVEWL